MPKTRDDFPTPVKRALAERAGHRCSICGKGTSGPSLESPAAVSRTGDAAHITAAAPGGPRYDPNLTPEQRRHPDNGIWLCAYHARLVDDDTVTYTVGYLKGIKAAHEGKIHTEQAALVPSEGKLAPRLDHTPQPFEYSAAVAPERFFGRRREIADIRSSIGALTAGSISIVGLPRCGKTSLLRYIAERSEVFFFENQRPIVVSIDFTANRHHTPIGIIEGLRREIAYKTGDAPWLPEQNGDDYAVTDGLARLRDRGIRLIVLLDELWRLRERIDHFQDWGADWRSKASSGYFALVTATPRTLNELYAQCGLISPFGNIFVTTFLGALEPEEQRLLVLRGFQSIDRTVDASDLALIDDLGGALPFYVQLAAALLVRHGDRGVTRHVFRAQAEDQLRGLWRSLTEVERSALHHLCGAKAPAPEPQVMTRLQEYGVLKPGGVPFSSVFAKMVREGL